MQGSTAVWPIAIQGFLSAWPISNHGLLRSWPMSTQLSCLPGQSAPANLRTFGQSAPLCFQSPGQSAQGKTLPDEPMSKVELGTSDQSAPAAHLIPLDLWPTGT